MLHLIRRTLLFIIKMVYTMQQRIEIVLPIFRNNDDIC